MMRVLLAGAGGQLGWELQQSCPEGVELRACASQQLDIRDREAVTALVEEFSPEVIINAAAYTAVDKAESDQATAAAVNSDGAENLAIAAKAVNARMVQVSTDYVFDGSHSSPYRPDAATSPLGVYGETKHQGELRVSSILPEQSVILRTSWVYSAHGNNFVKSMLRLMSEREELGIVADQVGTPTHAATLAQAVWECCVKPSMHGVYHWTDAGVASWYDFAVAIMEEGLARGFIKQPINLKPIRTEDYPTPAKRPAYSVLDKTSSWEQLAIAPQHWRAALRNMLAGLR